MPATATLPSRWRGTGAATAILTAMRDDLTEPLPTECRGSMPAVAPACPLCGDASPAPYHTDRAREYLRCARCALVFVHPASRLPPLAEVMRYLEHRNDPADEGYVRFLSLLADPLRARLPAGSRGLDYGCGPAPVLGGILTAAGLPTVSCDPLFHLDESLLERTYDFVTCSEVLEHVHEPGALFPRLAALVRPGGTLAIMTRFHGAEAPFATWWYRRDATHVCFYHADTMRWIAARFGWPLELPVPNVALFTVTHAAQPRTPLVR